MPFGAKASYEANEEWNENFLGINEESTDPNTIVFKTNRAVGDVLSLKVSHNLRALLFNSMSISRSSSGTCSKKKLYPKFFTSFAVCPHRNKGLLDT